MDSPTPETASPYFKPMTLALAGLAVLAAMTAVLDPDMRPWNLTAIGALALFATARLRFSVALPLIVATLALKEVGVYLRFGYEPYPPAVLCFALYAALGYGLLRKTESPLKIGGTALGAGVLFFLVTNFGAWLEQSQPYGYSLEGLMNCYIAGIPFHRGTILGDMVFSAVLFGAHAVLSRVYFPLERVAIESERVA